MNSLTLMAPAKINLYLEILGDRPDGFHELAMVLQTVSLADQVTLTALPQAQFDLICRHPLVPQDERNLAYRAALLMAETFPDAFRQHGGATIQIDKHIPVGAGLAGGSTDAAAVLVGLDLLWSLGLTQAELETLGSRLGSDVPFCVAGGTILATGRGEVLTPLACLEGVPVVLAKYRSILVETPWAYQAYRDQFQVTYASDEPNLAKRRDRVHSGSMLQAINRQDIHQVAQHLRNDLERVVLPAHGLVKDLRHQMGHHTGVMATMMSGSGPTVFALCETRAVALNLAETIQMPDLEVWVCELMGHGIRPLEDALGL
jgi:4-diphosphocytidyl-2-C-methyl-D-erythritol kinase